jgi:hypothetical protein
MPNREKPEDNIDYDLIKTALKEQDTKKQSHEKPLKLKGSFETVMDMLLKNWKK